MDPKHHAFLNAYIERDKLMGFACTRPEFEQNCAILSSQEQARLTTLDENLTSFETPLFNRQNVRQHLQALSSEGQHLDRELNLNLPNHYRKINAASLAFNDDNSAWQNPDIALEDKFAAMRLKVTLKCDKPEVQNPSIWNRRLGLLRDIAVQGSATAFVGGVEGALAGAPVAGVGSVPGALMGAGYGFFSSAFALTAAYAFTPTPEAPAQDGIIDCELVSLLPEYFIAGNVPDRLLTSEARTVKEQTFQIQLGQQTLNHLLRLFPCSPEEISRLNEASVLQQVGAMFAENKEDTQVLLQAILKQQTLSEQAAARDRQTQKQERQTLLVLLGGIDKQLAQMDAQMRAEKQAAAQAARVERAKQAAAGLVQMGTSLNSPLLQKIGSMGSALIGLEQSLLGTLQSFKSLAQDGMSTILGTGGVPGLSAITGCFSFLAGPIGIVSAAISLFSLFSRSKQNDGLAKALQGISKQIVALHKEMRQSFQYTWDMLNEMEQRQYERFELTLRAIDYIGTELTTHIDMLASEQRTLQHQFEQGMQQLGEYVRLIAEQPMLDAFERARFAPSKRISKHLEEFVAPIHIWLIRTATLDETHGQVLIPSLGNEQQSLWNSRLEEQLTKLTENNFLDSSLGFYRSLVASVVPHFVDDLDPQHCMNPNKWLPVQAAYVELIQLYSQSIAAAEPRIQQNYVDTFRALLAIVNTNLGFINRFADGEYAFILINQLIDHYQTVINAMGQAIEKKIKAVNQALAGHYGSGHFTLDQTLAIPSSFNMVSQTTLVNKTQIPSIPFLPAFMQQLTNAEDIFSQFLQVINKQYAECYQALLAFVQHSQFMMAHSIGAINLIFDYDMSALLLGGLVGQCPIPVSLSLTIKGTNYLLCEGVLLHAVTTSMYNGRLPAVFESKLINFKHHDLTTVIAAISNTLPKEETLAAERKWIGEHCISLMPMLTRRALEMATLIKWIAPNCMSESALLQGLHNIKTTIDTLITSPTVEHLQIFTRVLANHDWLQMLGRTDLQGNDSIAKFSFQLQTQARLHPLVPVLTKTVGDLENLVDALPLWITQYQQANHAPVALSTQLDELNQRLESLMRLDDAWQTNYAKQLDLEHRSLALDILEKRTKNLIDKQIFGAEPFHHLQLEQAKVAHILRFLSEENIQISNQRRQLLQIEAKYIDLQTKVTANMQTCGWLASAAMSKDVSSSSVNVDVTQERYIDDVNDNNEASQLLISIKDKIFEKIMQMAENVHIDLPSVMSLIHKIWTEVMQHLQLETAAGILLLGDTRIGKSTLINYLLGTIYQYADLDMDNLTMGVVVAGGEPERAKTSSSMHSETFALSLYDAEPFSLIDTPGTKDNREESDASHINAFEVAQAVGFQLLGAKLAAFKGVILAIEMSDLVHSNIEAILNPFRKIARLIGKHSQTILANTLLVVTKQDKVAPRLLAIAPSLYLKRYRDNLLQALHTSGEQETVRVILDHFIANPDKVIVSDLIANTGLTKHQIQHFFEILAPISTKLFHFEHYSKELTVFYQLVTYVEGIKNQYIEAVSSAMLALATCEQMIQDASVPWYMHESEFHLGLWDAKLSVLEAHCQQRDTLRRQLNYAQQVFKAAEMVCAPIISVRDAIMSQQTSNPVVVSHPSFYQAVSASSIKSLAMDMPVMRTP